MTIIRGAEIAPPAISEPKSTLLDHAKVVDTNGPFGLRNDAGGLWPSYNTGFHVVMGDFCEPDAPDFATAPWATGITFALQMGWECGAVGLDTVEMNAEALRVFKSRESAGIEKAIREAVAANDLNDAVLSAGARTPAQTLAMLEGVAAATYAGLPTIFVSRFGASLLNDRIVWEGDKAYTRLGSKVVISSAFDTSTPVGTTPMYASGEIYIERSEQIEVIANVIPGDGAATSGSGEGFADNTVIVVVERLYRVAFDPIRNDGTNVLTATATEWAGP